MVEAKQGLNDFMNLLNETIPEPPKILSNLALALAV